MIDVAIRDLTLACTPYDRMLPLFLGDIPIEGIRLKAIALFTPTEIFRRMVEKREFDIAEMPLALSFRMAAEKSSPVVAIPVFPSRTFRHGFIFVNREAGIHTPADLAGKRIGVQNHGMSAAVWIRGILRNQYNVDFSEVTWVEGGVNEIGAGFQAAGSSRGRNLTIETVEGRTLSEMLADGSIDAMIGAWVPHSFYEKRNVVRLFENYKEVEKEFFAATGIFPIMHVLGVRKDVHQSDPGVARKIFDACVAAKNLAMQRHRITGALSTMLPWLYEDLDEIDAVFGKDFWPYGLKANRKALQAFGEMLVADGAIEKCPPLEDVIAPLD